MTRVFFDGGFSANTYKVRLLLHMLDLEHERVELNIKDDPKDPRLLEVNPTGLLPALLDDGVPLGESNAILIHLARGTPYWSDKPTEQDAILSWMFFEQNGPEPNIGNARDLVHFHEQSRERDEHLARRQAAATWALGVLEKRLAGRDWVALDRPTVADIALFAYTHVAPEGGVSLDAFPNIRAWLDRVRALPRFIPMT